MCFGGAFVTSILVLGSAHQADARRAGDLCVPVHVVVDTAAADTEVVLVDGRGFGQVVLATDTLVSAVTVWVPAKFSADYVQTVLYVTAVDSTNRPIITSLIYASQELAGSPGDGVHPGGLTFNLDPPAALPSRGKYFFDINEESCLGAIRLMATSSDPYATGGAWKTGVSSCDGKGPGSVFNNNPALDLIFDVAFCPTSTPIHRNTWGELKTRYH